MILSDGTIRKLLEDGRIRIEPLGDDAIQPASVDLRVGHQFRTFVNHRYPIIDVRLPMDELTQLVEASPEEPFVLHPGEFALASTLERVALPDDLVATLNGKSSLGRLGLVIHQTAGWADPGFEGHLTLELANAANLPITIYPGMKIGQISFMTLDQPAEHPYGSRETGSKYQGQEGPTASRYHLNFEGDT